MNEFMGYAWSFAAGAVIGIVFYGGLWWTVHRAMFLPLPALWFLGSSILRTGFALAGFWLVTDGNWKRVVVCLAGFLAARLVVTWRTRVVPKRVAIPVPSREASDAT